jgi:drug/metabolite transporter (DMT)-like permease
MPVTSAAMITPSTLTLPDHLSGAGVLAAMVVLGVVCTGMTLVLFYTMIARTGPARAALAFYLSPAFAVLFGMVFLREQLTPTAVVGLCAIGAGCLLAAECAEPSLA